MKKSITILVLCLSSILSFAQQAPAIQWQKALGGTKIENANSIYPTPDGGYIVVGYSNSFDGDVSGNHGAQDVWVVKLSSTGNLQWNKALGGTGADIAFSIQLTPDGGYILVANTYSNDGNVTGYHGNEDAWVVKLSSAGTLQWQKTLGGTGFDFAMSIQPTPDGGYILGGNTNSIDGDITGNLGSFDAWVVKLSSAGSLEWQKSLGGTADDHARSIQLTPDGGYIVAGNTNSNDGDVSGNHGFFDAWVVKLSSSGNLQWQKCLGGTGDDTAASIQPTPDGGYIMGGFTQSIDGDVTNNHGYYDAWVIKLTSAGSLEWQKSLGGTNIEEAGSIQTTADGGYIVASYTKSQDDGEVTGNHGYSDAWLVKLSSTGNLQWQKCFGGTDWDDFHVMQPTADGGYIVAGSTSSNNGDVAGNHGLSDAWVVKLGPELDTSTFNNQELALYPNPTKGLLQLQTPNNTNFDKISITDSTGKIVLEQTQNTSRVNVEQLATGLYIIKAFSGEEVFVNKFVKE